MGLQNLVIPTLAVKVSDSAAFAVRGLSPYDVTALFMRHRGQMSEMFDTFLAKLKSGVSTDINDAAMLGASIASSAPDIVAEVIALAADGDPARDDWDADVAKARRLSVGVQTDAIQKIASLTFTSEMPLGNFVAVVASGMQSATAAMNQVNGPRT